MGRRRLTCAEWGDSGVAERRRPGPDDSASGHEDRRAVTRSWTPRTRETSRHFALALARLRSENSRLTRLLELTGDESAPSPQQSAAPLDHPGLVTMTSPTEAKVTLYQNLFRCRTDVYAIRWENRKTGRTGWGPANEGGWRARVERCPLRYLPLADQVFAAHLKGDMFIGLYPLMKDSTCHFVAADFDA